MRKFLIPMVEIRVYTKRVPGMMQNTKNPVFEDYFCAENEFTICFLNSSKRWQNNLYMNVSLLKQGLVLGRCTCIQFLLLSKGRVERSTGIFLQPRHSIMFAADPYSFFVCRLFGSSYVLVGK